MSDTARQPRPGGHRHFRRPSRGRDDDRDRGRRARHPANSGEGVGPPLLVGFVRWNPAAGQFADIAEASGGSSRRYAGVNAATVAGIGNRVLVQLKPSTAAGDLAFELDGTTGALRFGPLQASGTIGEPLLEVDKDGNLKVKGTLSGRSATGAVLVQSGLASDGLILPLPPGVTEDQVADGDAAVHVLVTPRIDPAQSPATAAQPSWAALVEECRVDEQRRLHCHIAWMTLDFGGGAQGAGLVSAALPTPRSGQHQGWSIVMSAKMTVVYLDHTGHVLAALREPDSGAPQLETLVGDAFPLRAVRVRGPAGSASAALFDLPPSILKSKSVALDDRVIARPQAFAIDGDRVAELPPAPAGLPAVPVLTQSTITIAYGVGSPLNDTRVLSVVRGKTSAYREQRIQAGKIAANALQVVINLAIVPTGPEAGIRSGENFDIGAPSPASRSPISKALRHDSGRPHPAAQTKGGAARAPWLSRDDLKKPATGYGAWSCPIWTTLCALRSPTAWAMHRSPQWRSISI